MKANVLSFRPSTGSHPGIVFTCNERITNSYIGPNGKVPESNVIFIGMPQYRVMFGTNLPSVVIPKVESIEFEYLKKGDKVGNTLLLAGDKTHLDLNTVKLVGKGLDELRSVGQLATLDNLFAAELDAADQQAQQARAKRNVVVSREDII